MYPLLQSKLKTDRDRKARITKTCGSYDQKSELRGAEWSPSPGRWKLERATGKWERQPRAPGVLNGRSNPGGCGWGMYKVGKG